MSIFCRYAAAITSAIILLMISGYVEENKNLLPLHILYPLKGFVAVGTAIMFYEFIVKPFSKWIGD